MNNRIPPCPHLGSHHATTIDIKKLGKATRCADCDYSGANLWICLQRTCLQVGCSEQVNDHSTLHFRATRSHCVHLNMSSQRAWCYLCEREVFLNGVEQSAQIEDPFTVSMRLGGTESHALDDEDTPSSSASSSPSSKTGMGLVGLQNIANTCYMNSALQALSNVLPMTHYFLNCGDLVQHTLDQAPHRSKAGLAKSYQTLMYDMWCRRMPSNITKAHLTPRGILYGIRSVHSMFRGFQQHDTQEFLRCFMDQLHEELKEPRPMSTAAALFRSQRQADKQNELRSSTSGSGGNSSSDEEASSACSSLSRTSSFTASSTDYETCESGSSESATLSSQLAAAAAQVHSSTAAANQVEQPPPPQPKPMRYTSSSAPTATQSQLCSIIGDIFDGKLLSSVQCLTCDRISTREETFQDLSLPIPNRDYLNLIHHTHSVSAQSLNSLEAMAVRQSGNAAAATDGWLAWMWNWVRAWLWGPSIALHDCMASFFSADELKGDNMYSCEKCNKLRTGVKYSQIMHLPEVLCIHLKRFRHDLLYSSKISAHVNFPLEGFDMKPYLHKDCTSHVSLYNLVSVICHHGTVGSGHYTCYARNSLNSRWYEYDDQFVREVQPETVQNCQAYVLFYGKHNPAMELIRAEASDLAATYPVKTADIRFYIARDWLARFNSFAEPGPITNWAMLCPHGGLLHSKIELFNQIAVPIAQQLWEYLYRKLGGGPAINMLFECDICKREAEALARRQCYELMIFTKYNVMDAELDATAIYAISMAWLRRWQQFVRGLTHKEPGPISNANIAAPPQPEGAAAQAQAPPGVVIRTAAVLRPGKSDYAQICAPLWHFLYGIYGGGPEIMLRGPINEEIEIIDQDEYEAEEASSRHVTDVSDTESNLGQRRTHSPVLNGEAAVAAGDAPAGDKKIGGPVTGAKYTMTSSAANGGVAAVTSTSEEQQQQVADMQAPSSLAYPWSYPSSRESKHGRHLVINGKKLKVAAALRSSFRRRGMKGRKDAMKHVDFFGPKGTYVQEDYALDSEAMLLEPDPHSLLENAHVGVSVSSGGESAAASQHSKQSSQSFPSESSQQSNQSRRRHHHEHKASKGRAASKLTSAKVEASESRSAEISSTTAPTHAGVRRRHHKSKATSTKNSITLQKYTFVNEAGVESVGGDAAVAKTVGADGHFNETDA